MEKPLGVFVPPDFWIPFSEIELTYARSSGPGGQNVNKVNSKAVLRWNLKATSALPEIVKGRVFSKLRDQLNIDGELVIASDRFRDQIRNREDCFEKLATMIAAAAQRPKLRKKTKPTFSSKRRTLDNKSKNSQKKSMRRSPRGRIRPRRVMRPKEDYRFETKICGLSQWSPSLFGHCQNRQ